MFGSFLSYLAVYILGALSLYLYQILYSSKSKPAPHRPWMPTTPPVKPVAKPSTDPAKPSTDPANPELTVVSANQKNLVPLDSSPTDKGKEKDKDLEKEKTEDGNNDAKPDVRSRQNRKAATTREARRYPRPPTLPSNDRGEGGSLVIGAPHKRGSTNYSEEPASAPESVERRERREKIERLAEKSEKSEPKPSPDVNQPASPLHRAGSGSNVPTMLNNRNILSQSMPVVKTTPAFAATAQMGTGSAIAGRKASKEAAKKRSASLRTFRPEKERLVEYKRGWMDIRSLKKFNRRYFILHSGFDGNWISYFRDEKMKRDECYGHIVLTGACTVHKKRDSECVFVIHHTNKTSIFSSKGPYGLIASSSHRMFHGKSAKCVLRGDDPSSTSKWKEKITLLCSDTPVAAPSLSLLAGNNGEKEDSTGGEEDSDTSDLSGSGRGHENSKSAATPREGEKEAIKEEEEEEQEASQEKLSHSDSDGVSEGESEETALAEPVYHNYEWPEEEKKAILALQEHAKDLLEQYGYLRDEYFQWRFLKARAFDIEATRLMLEKYFNWRTTFRPEAITLSEVMEEVVKGKLHFNGYDNFNRPILVVYAANHNPKETSLETLIKFTCLIIETAVKKMPPPVQTYSVIVDMTNFGYSNVDYGVAKEAAALFQDVYPERLGVLMCVNCPFIVNAVWHVIKPMLDDRTKKKVNFLKHGKELIKTGIFPLKWIPKHLGGECEFKCPPESIGLETLE